MCECIKKGVNTFFSTLNYSSKEASIIIHPSSLERFNVLSATWIGHSLNYIHSTFIFKSRSQTHLKGNSVKAHFLLFHFKCSFDRNSGREIQLVPMLCTWQEYFHFNIFLITIYIPSKHCAIYILCVYHNVYDIQCISFVCDISFEANVHHCMFKVEYKLIIP